MKQYVKIGDVVIGNYYLIPYEGTILWLLKIEDVDEGTAYGVCLISYEGVPHYTSKGRFGSRFSNLDTTKMEEAPQHMKEWMAKCIEKRDIVLPVPSLEPPAPTIIDNYLLY